MKFLDAQRTAKAKAIPAAAENKMMKGSRPDQGGASDPFTARRQPPQENKQDNAPVEPETKLLALAASLGVDFSTVKGTGRFGKVLERDVRAAASTKGVTDIPLSGPKPDQET